MSGYNPGLQHIGAYMAKDKTEYNLITYLNKDNITVTKAWAGDVYSFNKQNRDFAIVFAIEINRDDYNDFINTCQTATV